MNTSSTRTSGRTSPRPRLARAGLALLLGWLAAGCASQSTGPSRAPQPAATTPTPTPTPTPAAAPVAATAEPATAGERPAYAELPPLEGEGWQPLYDGQSLNVWKVTDFAGHGSVEVKNGNLVLEMGATLTGVNLVNTNGIPAWGYELAVDAMKVDGQDFFCGLTFVVGESCCTFVVGGWGGGVVGVSSIDGSDASMNETTKFKSFESKQWYRLKVRVTRAKLETWIGKEKFADIKLEGRRISMRPGEIELNQPFGLATYQTTGAYRSVQWRPLK